MRSHRAWAIGIGFVALAAPLALLGACGARTGLLVPVVDVEDDGGARPVDASADARVRDASPDALPSLDATPLRDANVEVCRDAGATLVYAVTETDRLLRFDPTTASFAAIGKLACNDPLSAFSMAVDRRGIAYVLYGTYDESSPGNIYRVSLSTSACLSTSFVAPPAFLSFGMGFSADDQGTGETLYIASDDPTGGQLGAIDTTTYAVRTIGTFDPPLIGAELSGTGDGRLFAFSTEGGPNGGGGAVSVAQIDKDTAKVTARNVLPGVVQGSAWAFAFWGGDFYLFTAPEDNGSIVQRYRPTDGSVTVVASYAERIVGAGVSTCAPQQ